MRAPFAGLDAVDLLVDARERHIEHREPLAGAAKRLPERLAPYLVRRHAVEEFVGAGLELLPGMDGVPRRRHAGDERRPDRADEISFGGDGRADDAAFEQPR